MSKLDALTGAEFFVERSSLAHAQFFNPGDAQGKYKPWGFGLTRKQAEAIGFIPSEEWEYIEDYEFKRDTVPVFITRTPSILWVVRGRMELENRETGDQCGPTSNGPFSEDYKANPAKYRAYTNNIIFLCNGKTGELLHREPLKLSARNAAGATIAAAYAKYEVKNNYWQLAGGFRKDVYDLFLRSPAGADTQEQIANGVRVKISPLFWAYWLFQPILVPKEVGQGEDTGFAAYADTYVRPRTLDDLERICVDRHSEDGQLIEATYHDFKHWMTDSPTMPTASRQEVPSLQSIIVRETERIVHRISFEGSVIHKPTHHQSREETPRPFWMIKVIESIRDQEHTACLFDTSLFELAKDLQVGDRVAITGEFTESKGQNPYPVLVVETLTVAEPREFERNGQQESPEPQELAAS